MLGKSFFANDSPEKTVFKDRGHLLWCLPSPDSSIVTCAVNYFWRSYNFLSKTNERQLNTWDSNSKKSFWQIIRYRESCMKFLDQPFPATVHLIWLLCGRDLMSIDGWVLFVWEMLEVSLEDNVFHTHGSPGRRLLINTFTLLFVTAFCCSQIKPSPWTNGGLDWKKKKQEACIKKINYKFLQDVCLGMTWGRCSSRAEERRRRSCGFREQDSSKPPPPICISWSLDGVAWHGEEVDVHHHGHPLQGEPAPWLASRHLRFFIESLLNDI